MINRFKNITEEMVELYTKKNSDYGDSVHDTYVKYGPVSFLVRMEDKINRVRKLTETDYSSKVTDEKVRDSLIDLANYAIIMILEMERENSMRVSCANYTIGIDHGTDAGDSIAAFTQFSNGLTIEKENEIWSYMTKKPEKEDNNE